MKAASNARATALPEEASSNKDSNQSKVAQLFEQLSKPKLTVISKNEEPKDLLIQGSRPQTANDN